ncbi:hypothetical protein FE257_007234 [Aspergillus nanangensis]|uniref:Uncharacterized protein n=1 Tax=Aspergillus nanangensis TaxID=2582783 RepID=A0AAD4CMZ8_ASPNN|nr:hypothetical protein FE257_007234 [Aspergillus nanangensis]
MICTFDPDNDMRRNIAQKRRIKRLESDRDTLFHLVDGLRESPNNEVMKLLHLIRSKVSIEDIKTYLDQDIFKPELEKTPELIELQSTVNILSATAPTTPAYTLLDTSPLDDLFCYTVSARPWTSVTDDDELVSHLIALWFTWREPSHNWIEKGLFLRDMRSGDVNAEFCSQLLVNGILAEACSFSDHPGAYADINDLGSRGLHFYTEARCHYEQLQGRLNIATLEGCGVLFLWYGSAPLNQKPELSCNLQRGNSMGATDKEKVGWLYLGKVSRLAEEYAARYLSHSDGSLENRAACHAISSVYDFIMAQSILRMKAMTTMTPTQPNPSKFRAYPGDILSSCNDQEDLMQTDIPWTQLSPPVVPFDIDQHQQTWPSAMGNSQMPLYPIGRDHGEDADVSSASSS